LTLYFDLRQFLHLSELHYFTFIMNINLTHGSIVWLLFNLFM